MAATVIVFLVIARVTLAGDYWVLGDHIEYAPTYNHSVFDANTNCRNRAESHRYLASAHSIDHYDGINHRCQVTTYLTSNSDNIKII